MCDKTMQNVYKGEESIVGKGENADYHHLVLYMYCYSCQYQMTMDKTFLQKLLS